jgi:Tfp pilus assembly protein PilX
MQRENSESLKRRRARQNERGVALITTLLLLMLLTGLTLAMAWSSRSDMLINGYYRNFRGSFYAADSGINIMRQALTPAFQVGGAGYPGVFAVGKNPMPPGTDVTVAGAINTKYGGTATNPVKVTGNGTGNAATSWPGSYFATMTLAQLSCVTDTLADCSVVFPPGAKGATYVYAYTITSTGQSQGTEKTVLTDSGRLTVSALIPNPAALNFAGYGMFIDQNTLCDGSTLVPGTITGPVFTNGSWNFGTGNYTFTDSVGQAGSKIGTSSGCPSGASNLPGNVTAQQGFKTGQPAVTLPKNSFNQEQAVIDGRGVAPDGSSVPPPTQSALSNALRNINNVPYPASGAVPPGVYLPYKTDANGKNPTFTGGGIMVSGNASIVLSPGAGTSQVYTITSSGGGTTTITITPPPVGSGAAGTTVVSSGGTNLTITGVPQQFDATTGSLIGPDTMLYVDGSITSLSGPPPIAGKSQPAINDGTGLTITAANNVAITGDILYKTEPVTGTPNSTLPPGMPVGTPIDSLIPGTDTKQALGIFTANGDIQLDIAKSGGNLEIDASMATLSQGGTGGIVNTGAAIGTLTIVGGRIQNDIKNIGATQRDVLFDKRFANNFAPPWFPSTGIKAGNNNATLNNPVVTRLQWVNQNNYF